MKKSLTLITLLTTCSAFSITPADIIYTTHAQQRMAERKISQADIIRTLEMGNIYACPPEAGSIKHLAVDPIKEIAVVFNPQSKTIISVMREATIGWAYTHVKNLTPLRITFYPEDYGRDADAAYTLENGLHYKLTSKKSVATSEGKYAVFYTKNGNVISQRTLAKQDLQRELEKYGSTATVDPVASVSLEKTPRLHRLQGLSAQESLALLSESLDY